MADKGVETPVINTRRVGLIERAATRRRGPRRQRTGAKSARRLFGFLFRTFRLTLLAGAGIIGGFYFVEHYVLKNARLPEGTKLVTDSTEKSQPDKPSPLLTKQRPTWERAEELIWPTRSLFRHLKKYQKEIPALIETLQRIENRGVFGESYYLKGSRYLMVKKWEKLKSYRFPVTVKELDSLSDNFEAAVERMKVGRAQKTDPETITKTYELAGKLLELPLEEGFYVDSRIATGPGAVRNDLKRFRDEILGPTPD